MNEQEKQNTTQDNKNNLADLEPNDEVKGGAGDNVWNGHSTGALRNVSNNNFNERELGLTYSGQSGGLNE